MTAALKPLTDPAGSTGSTALTAITLGSALASTATADSTDARYAALLSRDARFDGHFFVGVSSTGIYCRPICRVRAPRRGHCAFFDTAALAEDSGFRPCLRCRPELAPAAPRWSAQDATAVLASAACHWLDHFDARAQAPTVQALAAHLGISDRHLRRIFQHSVGIAPLQYLATQRRLRAKQLLTDTRLPLSEVAELSGFGSVRRFQDHLQAHYGLTPSRIRATGRAAGPGHLNAGQGPHIQVVLSYRPPFNHIALLTHLAREQVEGVARVNVRAGRVQHSLRLSTPQGHVTGWLDLHWEAEHHRVRLRCSDSLGHALPQLLRQVRHWLDLDAEPTAIAQALAPHWPQADGIRLPGTLDALALAVRSLVDGTPPAVPPMALPLAGTPHSPGAWLCAQLALHLGTPMDSPWPHINRVFPTPSQLLQLTPTDAHSLGLSPAQHHTLMALCGAMERGLTLTPGTHPDAVTPALQALPGLPTEVVAHLLRHALHWPDCAEPTQATHPDHAPTSDAVAQATQACAPWRSYAVQCQLGLGLGLGNGDGDGDGDGDENKDELGHAFDGRPSSATGQKPKNTK